MCGCGDVAAAVTIFGLRGSSVSQASHYTPLFQEHQGANIASLSDMHIDDLLRVSILRFVGLFHCIPDASAISTYPFLR